MTVWHGSVTHCYSALKRMKETRAAACVRADGDEHNGVDTSDEGETGRAREGGRGVLLPEESSLPAQLLTLLALVHLVTPPILPQLFQNLLR